MRYRYVIKSDFAFIEERLSEKDLSFDEINMNASFVAITEDNEIVSYVFLLNNRDNLPEILKHTDAYTYNVVDIYMKEGHEDDFSRTSFYLIKTLNQYAYLCP